MTDNNIDTTVVNISDSEYKPREDDIIPLETPQMEETQNPLEEHMSSKEEQMPLEEDLPDTLVQCSACREGLANQQAHMYPGGCLSDD